MKNDDDLYKELDKYLEEKIDKEILNDLEKYLNQVKEKSRALASSLNRCFHNAKKSMRYVEAFKLGQRNKENNIYIKEEEIESYLNDKLKDFFEKNDFMHYREFIRLLRACTIDVGGEVSFEIKKRYNDFFSGKRLRISYNVGLKK